VAEEQPESETYSAAGELASTIALEEYKAARAEILDRVKNEFVLVTASAIFTGAAVALMGQASTPKLALFCGLPLLSFVLAFLHFAQETSIAVAAAYVNKRLAPSLRSLSGADSALSWEEFRARHLYRGSTLPRLLVAVGTTSPAVPGVIITLILTFLLLSTTFRAQFHAVEWTLLSADWICLAALVVLMRWNKRLFDAITDNT
jgi:hypothetical protein